MSDRRDGKVPPDPHLGERTLRTPSKLWKKKYKCKKNKGDHSFVVALLKYASWHQEKDGTWIMPERVRWFMRNRVGAELPYWVEWHCSACGKHAYEYQRLDKKFDKFRPA